ncbi:hypothetical protein [Gluconacetobacter diazotrophicus]|nr:hypothetical protein [Gluconacetobacter diazotrophicus]
MEIALNAAVWPEWDESLNDDDKKKRTVIEPYKIVLPIQNWSRRTRVAFIDIFEAMRQEQKKIVDDEKTQGWNVYAFFLARQVRNDLSKFEVLDHRLVTFLVVKDDDLPVIAIRPQAKTSRPGLKRKPFLRLPRR